MSESSPGLGEEIMLSVGRPAHGGHCLARPLDDPDGHVVFVRHALPGETVRAVLTHRTSKVWRADAVEVLTASPDRVEPAWPEAGPGGVGGGELSHVRLPAQRTWKRWVLADCLRRIGGPAVVEAVASLGGEDAVPVVEPMPSEDPDLAHGRVSGTGTRTRVGMVVDDLGRVGMHAFRSSRVVALDDLALAVPRLRGLGLTGPQPARVWRRYLQPGVSLSAVAPSASEPLVVVRGLSAERGTGSGRGGRRAGAGAGQGAGRLVLSAEGRPLQRRRVTESVDASSTGLGQLTWSVDVEGFWQVHRHAPGVLLDAVVRGALLGALSGEATDLSTAGAGTRVLELYSGAGLFTVPLAASGAEVVSLEGSEQAVRDARRNLHDHPLARLLAGRVSPAAVRELGQGADVVVLDPPRQGAGEEVVRAVAAVGAARVVMVSCDPAAASRDAAVLLGAGYGLGGARALDMFPHTHHFETLMVFERS